MKAIKREKPNKEQHRWHKLPGAIRFLDSCFLSSVYQIVLLVLLMELALNNKKMYLRMQFHNNQIMIEASEGPR